MRNKLFISWKCFNMVMWQTSLRQLFLVRWKCLVSQPAAQNWMSSLILVQRVKATGHKSFLITWGYCFTWPCFLKLYLALIWVIQILFISWCPLELWDLESPTAQAKAQTWAVQVLWILILFPFAGCLGVYGIKQEHWHCTYIFVEHEFGSK